MTKIIITYDMIMILLKIAMYYLHQEYASFACDMIMIWYDPNKDLFSNVIQSFQNDYIKISCVENMCAWSQTSIRTRVETAANLSSIHRSSGHVIQAYPVGHMTNFPLLINSAEVLTDAQWKFK